MDAKGRPTSRVMHPIWEWDGERLTGWLTTTPSPKVRQLADHPYVSCGYYDRWAVAAVADGRVEAVVDDVAHPRLGAAAGHAAPAGVRPGRHRGTGLGRPTAPGFVVAQVQPWRVQVRRVRPGVGVELRTWRAP